ncbi:hypothetical protein T310_9059, partial [Rasamsonia emersonii CBS 393.64]
RVLEEITLQRGLQVRPSTGRQTRLRGLGIRVRLRTRHTVHHGMVLVLVLLHVGGRVSPRRIALVRAISTPHRGALVDELPGLGIARAFNAGRGTALAAGACLIALTASISSSSTLG